MADTLRSGIAVDEKVMPREKQAAIRKVLEWYKTNHPVWFSWLELS